MPLLKLPVKPNVFFVLAVISLGIGCLIPSFYDWTGSNQSHASPIVGWTAIGLLIAAVAISAALPWLPGLDDLPGAYHPAKFRFNLRTILIAMTASAVFAAVLRASLCPLVGVASCLVALGCAVYFWITFPQGRGRLLSMLACMYLPFAWAVNVAPFPGGLEALALASGLPMLLPMLFASSLLQRHVDQLTCLASVLTSFELLVGLWLIRLDRRLAIAFLLFVLLLATFGSFALNALVRM